MSVRVKQIITQLIEAGKKTGLTQAQLAEQVNMTPVGLSKAKKRGDMLASTLDELADALGFELVLTPKRLPNEEICQRIRTGTLFNIGARKRRGAK